jgi:hypothetical protein
MRQLTRTILVAVVAMVLLAGCGEASQPLVDIDATVEARLEQALTAVPTPTAPLPTVSAAQTLAPTDAAVIAALPPTPITPPIRGVPPTVASAIDSPHSPQNLFGVVIVAPMTHTTVSEREHTLVGQASAREAGT